ncbi:GlsB/YeaQ/YmgE family stress response membrane protein [Indioceanicola profundi]|uniref:GlsB/YeaQ/YmgE family stress response membrane protein n=1 Tax=Indioceanicola profundi TaxID=2220096 RepID=UPI000E6AB18A|nr:GlsB/YeaQ/YmgE family stress response membrane protein [Indioceanicola profundi]
MGIIAWIILGLIAGWLAHKIMHGAGAGLVMNLVLGIVGAFVGGFLVRILGGAGVTGFNIWSLIVATLGAVVVLWLFNKLSSRRSASL